MMTVYHNARCAKSRNACTLLTEKGVSFETIEYLKAPLTEKELFKGKELSEKEWIAAMIIYPKLMERPIVVSGKSAVVGRPTEKILELL